MLFPYFERQTESAKRLSRFIVNADEWRA